VAKIQKKSDKKHFFAEKIVFPIFFLYFYTHNLKTKQDGEK
jgi:hypothetical protein